MKAHPKLGRALLLLLSHDLVRYASCYSFLLALDPAVSVPQWLPRTWVPALSRTGTSQQSFSYSRSAASATRSGGYHRCRTKIRHDKLDRSSSRTALALSVPSAAAASLSRWSNKYWLRNHKGIETSNTDIQPSPAVWIELSNEEAAVLEQRRRLVRQIDDCEAALRRLRYDRVDYLVRQQQVQTQQKQMAAIGAAVRTSLIASRKVGTNNHADTSSGLTFKWRNYEATETVRRSVVKALLWRMLAESLTYAMALQWFRSAAAASRFVASTCLLKLAVMVVWERAFSRRPPRNASTRLQSQAVNGRPHRPPVYSESSLTTDGVIRSLAKALTWRALVVSANSYLLLRMVSASATGVGEAATEAVLGNGVILVRVLRMEAFKAALLFVYERIWNRIDWGKIRDSQSGMGSQ